MPAEGIPLTANDNLLTTEELLTIIHTFIDEGVTKVRFTGGEPSLRSDLPYIIAEVAKRQRNLASSNVLPHFQGIDTIGMTTNGLVLTVGNRLRKYVEAGLTSINISLDTLDPLKFPIITRREGFQKVIDSLHLALELGLKTKINCVVRRGINDDEVGVIAGLAKDLPIQVRFIEYMPFDGNKWESRKLVATFEMLELIEQHLRKESNHDASTKLIRRSLSLDEPDKVARMYEIEGYKGSVGFISSMTNSFCSSCNRLRITADGNLKVCLFGQEEVSLRDVLRDPTHAQSVRAKLAGTMDASQERTQISILRDVIQKAVHKKKESHADPETLSITKNRPMITIGG